VTCTSRATGPITEGVNPKVTWICISVGSTIGGLVPNLWGAGALSTSGLLGVLLGAIGGVWLAVKLS